MVEHFNGRRPPPGRQYRAANDTTALCPLRQEALPTLGERRRLARAMLAHQQAELGRQIRVDPGSEKVRTTLENIDLLRRAIDYLGPDDDGDLRRNLYRLFALPLPPPGWPGDLRPGLTEDEKARALRIGRIWFKSAGATRKKS